MGHLRHGRLPQSRKWRQVVALLDAGASEGQVAAAAADASQTALKMAAGDPLFLVVLETLAELPLVARGPGFAGEMVRLGLRVPESLPGLLGDLSDRFDLARETVGGSDIGEIGHQSALVSLARAVEADLPSLFAPTPQELRRALGALSVGQRFAGLARSFFAEVARRTLDYYLSRELANHTGPGRRFASDAERVAFDAALARHAVEASRTVEDYAGGWSGKAVWQGGGLTPQAVKRFASYAMTKLTAELARRDDAA